MKDHSFRRIQLVNTSVSLTFVLLSLWRHRSLSSFGCIVYGSTTCLTFSTTCSLPLLTGRSKAEPPFFIWFGSGGRTVRNEYRMPYGSQFFMPVTQSGYHKSQLWFRHGYTYCAFICPDQLLIHTEVISAPVCMMTGLREDWVTGYIAWPFIISRWSITMVTILVHRYSGLCFDYSCFAPSWLFFLVSREKVALKWLPFPSCKNH
jgi:hypothetical protein